MKSVAEQYANWCKHFNGIGKPCSVGVEFNPHLRQIPCIKSNNKECEKQVFPTMEEAQKHEEEMMHLSMMGFKARERVQEHHRKTNEKMGTIECPNCEKNTLRYTVSSLNNHIHLKCDNCQISLME